MQAIHLLLIPDFFSLLYDRLSSEARVHRVEPILISSEQDYFHLPGDAKNDSDKSSFDRFILLFLTLAGYEGRILSRDG